MINYVLLILFLSFLNCSKSKIETEKQESKKPNVLFICVDDLRPELGCYGNDQIYSPNMDKLASDGVLFKNHFVQIPTCGASRCSMLTGMLPATKTHLSNEAIHKLISSQTENEKPESFIHHLKRNGYFTVGIGKISHYADGLLYGYTDPVSTERELPHSWNELIFNPGKWQTGWNAFFAYENGENRQSLNRQVKPYEIGNVGDNGYPDGLSASLAINKLKQLAKKEQPFFLGVGFFKPHLPFNAPKKYWDLYSESEIQLSQAPNIPENVNLASLHSSGEFNGYQLTDEKASLTQPLSNAYSRKVKHAYYACVSYIDAQIGKLMDELEQQGLAENTIVVVWGDHGWHLGDQRVWGKHTIFEQALKSTFILKAPNLLTRGKSIDKIVSTVDIYPTLMELCGVEIPHETDGKSLVQLVKNPFLQNWENASYGYFRNGISLRTDRYRLSKYFRTKQPVIELYDHKTDPHESVNIASERPEIVEQLMPLWERGNTGIFN